MEGSLSFLDRDQKALPKDFQAAVIGQLEIVDTRHDTGEVVIGRVWRFAGAADNGENWC